MYPVEEKRSGLKSPPARQNATQVYDGDNAASLPPLPPLEIKRSPDALPDALERRARQILDKLDPPVPNVIKNRRDLGADPDLELLTTRRRRFVEEFMICGNATKAAELAGFSSNRAEQEGSELLKDPIVAGVIARREADLYKRLGLSQERVLTERAAIALADLGEVFTERADGTPAMRPFSEWSPSIRKAIKSIKVKRHDAKIDRNGREIEDGYDIVELGLWDKPAQLEKIETTLEADRKRGDTAEQLTEKQRIRKIAEILSRGRAALEASKKKPTTKKSA